MNLLDLINANHEYHEPYVPTMTPTEHQGVFKCIWPTYRNEAVRIQAWHQTYPQHRNQFTEIRDAIEAVLR